MLVECPDRMDEDGRASEETSVQIIVQEGQNVNANGDGAQTGIAETGADAREGHLCKQNKSKAINGIESRCSKEKEESVGDNAEVSKGSMRPKSLIKSLRYNYMKPQNLVNES